MVQVSKIDDDGDWTFGKGRANYISDSDAIAQNVKTRLRSFINDWFLDMDEGLDWYTLLGKKGTEPQIVRQAESRILQTYGVRSIERLEVTKINDRELTLEVDFTTIFDVEILEQVGVTL